MDVPIEKVDGLVVEFQGREGGEVFPFLIEGVSRPKTPVEEVAFNFFCGIPGEIRGVSAGKAVIVARAASIFQIDRGLGRSGMTGVVCYEELVSTMNGRVEARVEDLPGLMVCQSNEVR